MFLARRLPRFYHRLDHLSAIIAAVDATASRTPEQIFAAEKALIQIQIEWEHFVRNLILDSATGKFESRSGPIISKSHPNLLSREAAAHWLIGSYPKRQHEPDWYLPKQAIDASIRLDVSNQPIIAAELGVTPWPIAELRHVRNFIAHKSKRSALAVRKTGIVGASTNLDVLEVALQYGTGGAKRYIEWVNFSKGAAARLVA
ncbi:hypothetical protein [Martelella mediterranea]|uniref:RiboL-PSP-HEPN domain-containing protein n=1 Tax=Martelella mediterranea TaxID=293089 RepID=A0A4R3NQQ7_9HYPH|nr:hypothetical protein [Martelella mediterranea]TCT37116.1 hypothetical protein EDC90_10207 [Martelella mediterranea]